MALNDIKIKSLKTEEKPYRLADSDGLTIEVRPTGSKIWRYRYRFDGKANMLTLGEYPIVTLQMARSLRDEARQQLAQGIDPSTAKKEAKQKRINLAAIAKEQSTTFTDIYNEWYQLKQHSWTAKHAQGVESRFQNYLAPIANMPLVEITPADCIKLLKTIETSGKLTTLSKVKIMLGQIMRYAVSTGKMASDPSRDISNDIFAKQVQRNFAHQTDPQIIRGVYATINLPYRGYTVVQNAIKLLALTFLRANELAGLKWAEVDFDHKLLRIQAERMKMKRDHLVPLSKQSLAIIEAQKEIHMGSPFVFPSWLNLHSHITTQSLLQAMRRQGVAKEDFTSHGWRHAASTTLHEIGYNPHAIEAQLAHMVGGVAGVYNKALYLEERTRMMQAWADWLEGATP